MTDNTTQEAVVQVQILSKILDTKSFDIVTENSLDASFFPEYKDEFEFIENHLNEYGNVPDVETFLAKFPTLELADVTETDEYLVHAIREEDLFRRSVPVVQRIAELLKSDANAAAEYMLTKTKELQPNYNLGGTDIVADALSRYVEYQDRAMHQDNWYIESGFPELDDVIKGLQRGEELFILFARLGQGKSWIAEFMAAHAWKIGYNVGYFSPEMSATTVGFRFDTILNHMSNRGLMGGNGDTESYKSHIEELATSHKNKFIVSTPSDFGRSVTVSKLRNWVKQYKLDMIVIDGIKYLSDERARRNDNVTTSLTNISEDLMSLSVEMRIPVIAVVQANRNGVGDQTQSGTPELESIRDSDGIAHNASKIISIHQKTDGVLEIGVKKNRFGRVGDKLRYAWDIDTCQFTYIASQDDPPRRREVSESRKPVDRGNVF